MTNDEIQTQITILENEIFDLDDSLTDKRCELDGLQLREDEIEMEITAIESDINSRRIKIDSLTSLLRHE